MDIEIICTLITVTGAFISAIVAWFISRFTTNKEIERMKLSWEHDDVVTSVEEFASMAAEVAKYVAAPSDGYVLVSGVAASKVAAVRARESGELAVALDKLYEAIRAKNIRETDVALSCVIEQKRKAKGQQNCTD